MKNRIHEFDAAIKVQCAIVDEMLAAAKKLDGEIQYNNQHLKDLVKGRDKLLDRKVAKEKERDEIKKRDLIHASKSQT